MTVKSNTEIRTYNLCRCDRKHRTYRKWVKCAYPKSVVGGIEGSFLTIGCRAQSIELHRTLEAAQKAFAQINVDVCGHNCLHEHRLVRVEL